MKLPNLSYLMRVGELRYIQNAYESGSLQNPDYAVGDLLSWTQKALCDFKGRFFLTRLKKNSFYNYVAVRTTYYDKVFKSAIDLNLQGIVNIGCGTDTRSRRFQASLTNQNIPVFELDQEESISRKKVLASKVWPDLNVEYLPLDLNSSNWPSLTEVFEKCSQKPILVMLEGVSPYIESEAFIRFLSTLKSNLHPDSKVAYDFKRTDLQFSFGKTDIVKSPFRLSTDHAEVENFHENLGFQVTNFESSSSLCASLGDSYPIFEEDLLLSLSPKL